MRKATENQGKTRTPGEYFSPRSKVKDLILQRRSLPHFTSSNQESPMKPSQVPNRLSLPPPRRVLPLQSPELCRRDRCGPPRQSPHNEGPIYSPELNLGSPTNVGTPAQRLHHMPRDRLGPPQYSAQHSGSFCSSQLGPVNQSHIDNSLKKLQSGVNHHATPQYRKDLTNHTPSFHIRGHQVPEPMITLFYSGSKTAKSQESNKAQSSIVRSPVSTVQLHRPPVTTSLNISAAQEVYPRHLPDSECLSPDNSLSSPQCYQPSRSTQSSDRICTSGLSIMCSSVAPYQEQQFKQTSSSEKLIPAVDLNYSSQKRRREFEDSDNNAKKLYLEGTNSGQTQTPKPIVCNSVSTSLASLSKQPSVLELPPETTDSHLCLEPACGQSTSSELSSALKPAQPSCPSLSPKPCIKRRPSVGAKQAYIKSTRNDIVRIKESFSKPVEESLNKTSEESDKRNKSSTLLSPEVPQQDTSNTLHSTSVIPLKTLSKDNKVEESRKDSSTPKSASKSNSGPLSCRMAERGKKRPRRHVVIFDDADELFTPDPMTYIVSPVHKSAKCKTDGGMIKSPTLEKGSSSSAPSSSAPVTGSSCRKTENSKATVSPDTADTAGDPRVSLPTIALERVKLENLKLPCSKDRELKNSPITSSAGQLKEDSVKSNAIHVSHPPKKVTLKTDAAASEQTSTFHCSRSTSLGRQSSEEGRRQSNEERRRQSSEGERRKSSEGGKRQSSEGRRRQSSEGERRQSNEDERRQSSEGRKRQSSEGERRQSNEEERRQSSEGRKRQSSEEERRQSSEGGSKQVNEEDSIDVELDLGLSFALDFDLTQSSQSSEEEQLLSLQEMMERVTKPPDTPEKGAFSEPSTPGHHSSQLKTQPLPPATKPGLYKNSLDQMLKEINTNKKAKEIETQLLTACKEDLLRIAEYEEAEENQEEGISTEQQEFLQRYSLMSNAIREVPPGEVVFNLEKFGQIFNQDTLQLRQCMVQPQGTAQKTLLWSSPAQLKLHLNIGLFQEAYDCHSPCPTQVTRFLFKMMSVHNERMVSEKLLQALCDIACTAAYQIVKNGSQQFKVWVPSLADVTLVLMNMGIAFVTLFPFENLQPPFTEGDLLEDIYIKSESSPNNKQQSIFPEHNCNNILKYLCYCMGLCPRVYSDDELLLLLTVIGRVALDTRLILQSSVELYPLQYKIVNIIRDWDTMLPRICLALTNLTDDHHNMCLLVQLLPDNTRGKQLRRHLSLSMISKLLDGNCTYRPADKEFQLSNLRPYLPCMQPSTLFRGMLRSQKDKEEDMGTLDQQSYYLCYSLLTLANEASNFQFFPAHQKEQLLCLCSELETHVKCDIRESEKCLYRSKVKDLVARIYTKWQMLLQRTRPLHGKLYDYWEPLHVDTLLSSQEGDMDNSDNEEGTEMKEIPVMEEDEPEEEATEAEENEIVMTAVDDDEEEDKEEEAEEQVNKLDEKQGETGGDEPVDEKNQTDEAIEPEGVNIL